MSLLKSKKKVVQQLQLFHSKMNKTQTNYKRVKLPFHNCWNYSDKTAKIYNCNACKVVKIIIVCLFLSIAFRFTCSTQSYFHAVYTITKYIQTIVYNGVRCFIMNLCVFVRGCSIYFTLDKTHTKQVPLLSPTQVIKFKKARIPLEKAEIFKLTATIKNVKLKMDDRKISGNVCKLILDLCKLNTLYT